MCLKNQTIQGWVTQWGKICQFLNSTFRHKLWYLRRRSQCIFAFFIYGQIHPNSMYLPFTFYSKTLLPPPIFHTLFICILTVIVSPVRYCDCFMLACKYVGNILVKRKKSFLLDIVMGYLPP